MAIRLPMSAARRLFYRPVVVYVGGDGEYRDGDWHEGAFGKLVIAGSFQPPAPLAQDIGIAGAVGLGERSLWTTAELPFYDIESKRQSWVRCENLWWRLTDRHPWDPYVSRNLFVYALERYHKTTSGPQPPEMP